MQINFFYVNKKGKVVTEKDAYVVLEKVVDGTIKIIIINGVSLAICPVYAAENTIMHGLQPVIKLITDVAEPVTYGYMVKGFLKFTQGNEEEAKKTLTNAGVGFLGVKFVPQIMEFLRNTNLF